MHPAEVVTVCKQIYIQVMSGMRGQSHLGQNVYTNIPIYIYIYIYTDCMQFSSTLQGRYCWCPVCI